MRSRSACTEPRALLAQSGGAFCLELQMRMGVNVVLTLGETHMPYRLDRMIVLAGVTMLIGVAPALAHGGGSHGHGHSSISAPRIGASTMYVLRAGIYPSVTGRAIPSPAPLARMLVTTALGAPPMTTKGPTTSAVADPPTDPRQLLRARRLRPVEWRRPRVVTRSQSI